MWQKSLTVVIIRNTKTSWLSDAHITKIHLEVIMKLNMIHIDPYQNFLRWKIELRHNKVLFFHHTIRKQKIWNILRFRCMAGISIHDWCRLGFWKIHNTWKMDQKSWAISSKNTQWGNELNSFNPCYDGFVFLTIFSSFEVSE